MIGNKHQPYTYSLKTAASWSPEDSGGFRTCGFILYAYLNPPEDALTVEGINTHLVLKFHDNIADAFKVIKRIGIINTMIGVGEINHKRMIDVNKTADANGIVDIEVDLSKLLKKENVEVYNDITDYPIDGNYIYIELDPNYLAYFQYEFEVTDYLAEVLFWKVDALYTTKKIR